MQLKLKLFLAKLGIVYRNISSLTLNQKKINK